MDFVTVDVDTLHLAGAELRLSELVGVPLGVEDHYLVLLGDVVVAIDRAAPYLRQWFLIECYSF